MIPEAEALENRMLIEGAHRILYVIGAGHIEVLAVLHGRRGSM